jgi:hypothetical protein
MRFDDEGGDYAVVRDGVHVRILDGRQASSISADRLKVTR